MLAPEMERPPPTAIGNGRGNVFSGQLNTADRKSLADTAQAKSPKCLLDGHFLIVRTYDRRWFLSADELALRYGISRRQLRGWRRRRALRFPPPILIDGVEFWPLLLQTGWERAHGG